MRRKNNNSILWGILILIIFFSSLGFAGGYYTYSSKANKEKVGMQLQKELEEQKYNSYLNNPRDGNVVLNFEDIIKEDTIIIYKTFYTQCEEFIEENQEPTLEIIGFNKDGLEKYLAKKTEKWAIETFSEKEVVLIKMENKVCTNHYLVSVKSGYIAIYKFDEEGMKYLIEQTSISIYPLPTVDQERLQKGILIKTLDNVNQLLEDYSG